VENQAVNEVYHKYNPQPSKFLLEQGNVIHESYYLAEGSLSYNLQSSENKLDCEFEVATMEDGSCWSIVYIYFPEGMENSFGLITTSPHSLFKDANKLIGKDYLRQSHIEVLPLHLKESKTNAMFFIQGLMLIFRVQSYFIDRTHSDFEAQSKIYCLANLPISKYYNPITSAELDEMNLMKELEQQTLRDTLHNVIGLTSTSNLPQDQIVEKGIQDFLRVKEEKFLAAPSPKWKSITFTVQEKTIAQLYWYNSKVERAFNNQPLSRLRVDQRNLPIGWNADNVAQWISVLLSVALGRRVIWNQSFIPASGDRELNRKEFWEAGQVDIGRFYAFTEHGNFHAQFGIDQDTKAVIFVQQILGHLFQTPFEETQEYLHVAINYTYYASVADDVQQRCTLLCALVENLFSTWKNDNKEIIKDEFPKTQRQSVMDAVEFEIKKRLATILPQVSDEPIEMYEKRSKKFTDRLRSTIGENLSQSFVHRLKSLFSQYDWYVNSDSSGTYNIGRWIEEFVKSRNKLFHENRFHYSNADEFPNERERNKKLISEINCIEMFVPLMLATILGYKGGYWDLIHDRWANMPFKW